MSEEFMTGESKLSQIPGTGSRVFTGNRFWAVSQAIVGPLVVAGVIFLVSDRNSAWDAIDLVVHELEVHIIEGKGRHRILDSDIEDLEENMDRISDRIANIELQLQRITVEIAKLPPVTWQERIIQNERDITVLKSKGE